MAHRQKIINIHLYASETKVKLLTITLSPQHMTGLVFHSISATHPIPVTRVRRLIATLVSSARIYKRTDIQCMYKGITKDQ